MQTMTKMEDAMKGKQQVSEASTKPARSSEKMRAITWQGKHNVIVDHVGKPMLTHDKDVIVKITACTICSGTDGHAYAGEVPFEKGLTIGHEGIGIVVEKGPGVSKLSVGDRVVISCNVACGSCEHCQKGQFSGCETTNDSKLAESMFGHGCAAVFGFSRLHGNVPGSQAEFVRVPFADVNCCKVPSNIPDEKALFVSDVLSTSLHAVNMGEVKQGDTVAIWGLGPIGLCIARWCQIYGARRVVGIDFVPERLNLARKAMNIEVVDRTGMTSQQLIDRMLQIEPKGFDVTIEAVGFRHALSMVHKMARTVGLESDTPEIVDECLTCLKPYGHVSVVGDYTGYANAFPVGKIMFKHATLRAGQNPCQKYFDFIMEKLRDGTFDPTFIISHRITMEQIPQAYEKLDKKEDGFIKVFCKVSD